MKQNTVDLELGLLWRREYEAFDVTLHSTSASEEDQHIEVPHPPLKLNPDDFAILAGGDPEEYAQGLTRNVFAVEEVREFLLAVANLADRDDMPLHVRLLLDPGAPGAYHALRWESLQEPRDQKPIALQPRMSVTRFVNAQGWRRTRLRRRGDLHALIIAADPGLGTLAGFTPNGRELMPIDIAEQVALAQENLLGIPTEVVAKRGRANLPAIVRRLKGEGGSAGRYDIVYLISLGALLEAGPVLYLEDAEGKATAVQGADFVDAPRNGTKIIKTIKPKDLGDLQNVDRALAKYYSDAVERAARSARLSERLIRDWFEDVLITQHGFRSQTDSGPGEDPRKGYRCIQSLEKQHLVRSEPRLNRPWYELIHDRLIDPIRNDNAAWRAREGFGDIARQAKLWSAGRSPDILLTANKLAEAILWLGEHGRDAYDYGREFVKESERVVGELQRQEADRILSEEREALFHDVLMNQTRSLRGWQWGTGLVLILSAVAIVVIVLARI